MKKSTHRVEVVRLDPFKHPNADALSIQKVFGYQVVIRTEDWAGVELGAYIVPDSVVDTQRPEFSWLAPPVKEINADGTETIVREGNQNFRAAIEGDQRFHRVTTMRMRGVVSYGLMVPAPEGAVEGDDVSDILGVTRHNPVIKSADGIEGPSTFAPDYDIEAYERYADNILVQGEDVVATEKLNGENTRYVFHNGKVFAGTKNQWIDPEKGQASLPWRVFHADNALREFILANRDVIIYGEAIGTKKPRYNLDSSRPAFYAFDILKGGEFLSYDEMVRVCTENGIKVAPEVWRGPYNSATTRSHIPKKTLIKNATNAPEGIVIRPLSERMTLQGRAVLKLVSSWD